MLTENINTWLLASDEYQAGLELLRQTGFTGIALTALSMGEDAYTRRRLETELRKWVDGQKNVSPIASAQSCYPKDNSVPVNPTIPALAAPEIPEIPTPATEPVAVAAIRTQIYQLMDERAEAKAWLRAKAELGNTDEAAAERLPHAIRIKTITRQIDELYSRLDFFNQHGYLPPSANDPAVIVDDQAALLNARSYVSRYKAKLKKTLTPEQRQAAEALLRQYSEEKDRLERKLSKPNSNDSHSTGQQTTDRPIHSPPLSGA
ncbi:hypothetical protein [Spirosoma areae]